MHTAAISISIGGILTLLIAVFHTRFYRLFDWGSDLAKLSPINRKLLYTIHIALLLLFFVFGFVSLLYADELGRSAGLALGVNVGLAAFWLWRGLWHLAYLMPKGRRPSVLWFVTMIWFGLLCAAYLVPPLMRLL